LLHQKDRLSPPILRDSLVGTRSSFTQASNSVALLPMGNLEIAKRYLHLLETKGSAEELGQVLSPDIVQEEYPNLLKPKGDKRGYLKMLEDFERGKLLIASQRYEILSATAQDDRVALEVRWTGVLAVPIKHLPAGAEMQAVSAMFLKFLNGKIVYQSNYDCFERF
jgi:ketosteroid isomerase-like protein